METHGFAASSYDAASYATMMGAATPGFKVAGPTDWRPGALGNSTRVVYIEAGKGAACGVLASEPNSQLRAFAANSGSVNRFDALVARWNWATNDVELMVLTGGAAAPAVNTTQSVNSALINRIPGVMYDGLVAIVRIRPGVTQLNADDVTDMRTWAGVQSDPPRPRIRLLSSASNVPGNGSLWGIGPVSGTGAVTMTTGNNGHIYATQRQDGVVLQPGIYACTYNISIGGGPVTNGRSLLDIVGNANTAVLSRVPMGQPGDDKGTNSTTLFIPIEQQVRFLVYLNATANPLTVTFNVDMLRLGDF